MATAKEIGAAQISFTINGLDKANAQIENLKVNFLDLAKSTKTLGEKSADDVAKAVKKETEEKEKEKRKQEKTAKKIAKDEAKALKEVQDSITENWKREQEAQANAQKKLDKFSQSLSTLGNYALVGFGMATAGIYKFVSAADPMRFQYFQASLDAVSIQIGRIFIPVLQMLTGWLRTLDNYLRSQTDAWRDNVAHIAMVVVGGLAAGVVFAKLWGVLTTGITVIRAFAAAMTFLTASSPVGWILTAIAALVTLFAVFSSGSGGMGGIFAGLMPALNSLIDAFKAAWNAVQPVFEVIISVISTVIKVLTPIFTAVADGFSKLFNIISRVLTPIFETIANVVQTLSDIFGDVMTPIVQQLASAFETLLGKIGQLVAFIDRISIINKLGGRRADANKPARPERDHAGIVTPAAPQLSGIADAWRKAQTADANNPQLIKQQQQLEAQEVTNRILEQMRITIDGMRFGGRIPAVVN